VKTALNVGGVIAFQAAAILGYNARVDTKQCESARELAATYGHDAVCKLLESHHNVPTGVEKASSVRVFE
jgi:hypothetical protein